MNELFIKIFNASVTASYIVLAVLLLRVVLKKAPRWIHCLLWGIVALRLIMPFSIESPLSLIPSAEPIPQGIELAASPEIDSGIPMIDDTVNPILSDSLSTTPAASANPMQIVVGIAAYLWIIGIALMLLYGLLSYLRLSLKVRPSLCDGDQVYLCDRIDTPFLLGLIRPRIYLPSGMDRELIPYVVRHEKAHLSRGDHLWKPIGFALLAVHWFNPLMWIAYILLCRDIETACDEKVIRNMSGEDKRGYSEALVSCSIHRRTVMACPLAFGEVGVKDRIKAMLHYKKPAFWVIVTAAFIGIAVTICFLTNPVKTVDRIMDEKGYTILDQYQYGITLSVPKSALSDSAFSAEGKDFQKNEVVAYQDDTTTVYLTHVQYANEGEERMYFCFDVDYDLPKERGAFLLPYTVTGKNLISTAGFLLRSKDLRDDLTVYEDAVLVRGQGPDMKMYFYVSTDVARAAEGNIHIDISLNRLTYIRGKANVSQNTSDNALLYSADYISALKLQYPEYFGLDTAGGLRVYFSMFAQGNYQLCLVSGTAKAPTQSELMDFRLISPDTMRAILSTYDLSPTQVRVDYFSHIISSYAATVDEISESIESVRSLLGFGNTVMRQIPPRLLIGAAGEIYDTAVRNYSLSYISEKSGTHELATFDDSEYGYTIYYSPHDTPVKAGYATLHFEIPPDVISVDIYDAETRELLKSFKTINRRISLQDGRCIYDITATWSTHETYSGTVQYEFQITK